MPICDECGKNMSKGYTINAGMEHFCCDECLHKHYSEEDYLEMYDGGEGESFWTEWDDEEGFENSQAFEPKEEK